MMKIEAINGFILPKDKLKIEQYSGFLSRKSRVFIKYNNSNKLKLLDYDAANEEFISWFASTFGESSDEYKIINIYRSKIENPSKRIIDLGNELINDYNFLYYYKSHSIYNVMPQICLIKLEQLFI